MGMACRMAHEFCTLVQLEVYKRTQNFSVISRGGLMV